MRIDPKGGGHARTRRPAATEPPQGVLPHCAHRPVAILLPKKEEPALLYRSAAVIHHPGHGRLGMSTIMKNKSLLLLPIGLAVLIVIAILTS